MLTRLRVSGFKNLVDADVRFGPFTCVAGANGTGKSNLFDAIHFLSLLADLPLLDAALSIRDEKGRSSDVENLFHRFGAEHDNEMSFEAEMIIPAVGTDDLGRRASATTTFVRYTLVLGRQDASQVGPGGLQIVKEELTHIRQSDAYRHLLFPHTARTWRRSAVRGRRSVPYYISTVAEGSSRVIKLHQDGGSSGRPLEHSAANLPRTVLSVVNAAERPTAALVRNEMRSWRLLQLEPSSLRRPDEFRAPTKLGMDGSNLAATLYHLARTQEPGEPGEPDAATSSVYTRVANRLSELVDDVHEVYVDRDDRRELLTVMVRGKDGTSHPAVALSDGTLRFLALAVIEIDPEATGLICLEEPENGIHPERIPAMLRLLQDIATDAEEPVGSDNALRQVIINTHSPAVVSQVPDESLVVAELMETVRGVQRFRSARFSALPETWRCQNGARSIPRGRLLAYLNPLGPRDLDESGVRRAARTRKTRVVDRPDLTPYLPYPKSDLW